MIKNYNNDDLQQRDVKPELFLFCQVWKELTDPRTFDSYQYRSFNIINGLKELLHNIESFNKNYSKTSHAIESVRQELIKRIKTDYVLQRYFLDLKNQLLSHLNKKVESTTNYKSLYYQIMFYYDLLINSYDAKLIDSIVECTNNADNKLIIELTSTYIGRCIDKGWSSTALNKKIDLGDNKEQRQFLEKILNFQPQNYAVFFPNRISVNPPHGKTKEESKDYIKNQFQKFNIKAISKQEIFDNFPEITQSKISGDEYLMISSKSMDIYCAAHDAIVNISNVLSVFSFFSAISSYDVAKKRIIVYNTDSPYTADLNYLDLYSTYEYLDSSSNVYSKVEDILNAEATEKELKQKLISSFNYTNLSHISVSVEEKYMNMWIALESLSRTEIQENIIGNILLTIPSACCLRYIYRKIRNFIEDCGRCDIDLNFTDLEINLQDGDKEGLVKK